MAADKISRAERFGVSKNAPYRHFATKAELLTVLAVDGFIEFADAEALGLQIWATMHGWAGMVNDSLLPKSQSRFANYAIEDSLFG